MSERLSSFNTVQWKRVCEVASMLLDAPPDAWMQIADRELGEDAALREGALRLCRDYSDSEELFGAQPLRPPAAEDSRIGQRIGVWRVIRLLGEGGMGRVYLVERADNVFSQRAAMKLIRGYYDEQVAQRFRNERRILGLLDHPAIARALDGGSTSEGAPYLVMEYVDGTPIDRYSEGRPVEEKLRLFLQVVDAIDVAHRSVVVHRDLKPSNVLVEDGGQAKVLDFGIARLLDDDASLERTRTAMYALTPQYASPEQLLQEPATTYCDIYSLGAVLYKLLTGRPPHDLAGQNHIQSIRTVTENTPVPPSRHATGISADLDGIVLKALDRNPLRRYDSAADFARDVRRFLDGHPVEARPARLVYRTAMFLRRNRLATIAAAAFAVVAAAGTIATLGEARLAKRRFEDVRGLAHSVVFEYDAQLSHLAGSTPLRAKMATDTVRYLDSIFADAGSDTQLKREIAAAYRHVGEIDGYARVPNLGRLGDAEKSLHRSMELWQSLVPARGGRPARGGSPEDRLELATSMERLASVESDMGKLAEAGRAITGSMDLLATLEAGVEPGALHREKAAAFSTASRLAQRTGEGMKAIDLSRRGVRESEQLPPNPLDPQGIAIARMQLAVCDNDYGLADPKLVKEGIDEARAAVRLVEEAPACAESSCRETAATILTRASIVLNESDLMREALPLTRSVELLDGILKEDPGNLRLLGTLRVALSNKASILIKLGDAGGSLEAVQRALTVAQAIAASDPRRRSRAIMSRGP